MSIRARVRLTTLFLVTLLPAPLHAQDAQLHRTQYWLSGGAGVGYLLRSGDLAGRTGIATSLAATVQRRALIGSLRWVRASDDPVAVWQVGLMAGLGSPTRFPLRGSVAAGLGLAGHNVDGAALTVPAELQLGWRLTPAFGLSASAFTNFGGLAESIGIAFGVQVGRLQ